LKRCEIYGSQIDSKKNNPLLNRTEVYFTVKHLGEKTPNREIVRNELAEKLSSKKENIVVNFIKPGFGTNETTGYAKIYSEIEETYILARNKLIEGKKKEKKTEKKPAEVTKSAPEKTEAATTPIEETNEPPKEEAKQKPAPEHKASQYEKDEKTQEKNSEETKE